MGVSKSSTSSNSSNFGCSLILISLIWVLLGPRPVLSDEILDEIGIHDSPSNTNSESDLKPTNEVKINYTINSNNANRTENEFTQVSNYLISTSSLDHISHSSSKNIVVNLNYSESFSVFFLAD